MGLERTVMYGGYVLGTSLEPPRGLAARGVPLSVVDQPSWGVGKATTALDLARLHRAVWLASGGLGPLAAGTGPVSPQPRLAISFTSSRTSRTTASSVASSSAGPGRVVLHKAGWIDPARHDAGLVIWRGGILVAAVMTYDRGGAGTRSDVLAGRVAQAAVRRFSG